jgi:N utilization substance protein B
MINKHAKGWTISRMARIDVAILRVAVYEILYREDIPFSVSVNEAVELAKKYSHDGAGSFINGILASIISEIEGANG